MKTITVKIQFEDDMEKLAADVVNLIPSGTVILLSGDLGAGKTVFARGFIRSAVGKSDLAVTSPTFNMVSSYDTALGSLYHYDLYRVKDAEEIQELGIADVYRAYATLIEWPDRLPSTLSTTFKKRLDIHIQIDPSSDRRTVTLQAVGFGVSVDTAFVFAAGLGTRMRDRVRDVPKPLVPVAGRPTLSYFMDQALDAGVTRIFLNTHYLPDKINEFADEYKNKFQIRIFHEEKLLETGGGLKRALPDIDRDIFYAMNGDALVDESAAVAMLDRLAMAFDPNKMDILLLVFPVDRASITHSVGDYTIDTNGRLTRSLNLTGTHMFAGIRLLHARVFDGVPNGVFSFRDQMDAAQSKGRLFGLVHTGLWHHISTPEDVDAVSTYKIEKAKSKQDESLSVMKTRQG